MEEFSIGCPYCGEMIDVFIDGSIAKQEYYEDCSVCCHPILIEQSVDELNEIKLAVKREDE